MLEALDKQQREYVERRHLANQDRGLSPEEIISVLLQLIEVENNPKVSTPEDLVNQAQTLLELKGERISGFQGEVGGMLIGNPKESYLEIPTASIEIAGREVNVDLGLPARLNSRYMGSPSTVGFGMDIGLHIGDDYEEIQDALIINDSGVHVFGDTTLLTSPNDLQKVSSLLTKVDRALSPKSQKSQ